MLHSVETQRRERSSLSEVVRKMNSDLSAGFCKKPGHLPSGWRKEDGLFTTTVSSLRNVLGS